VDQVVLSNKYGDSACINNVVSDMCNHSTKFVLNGMAVVQNFCIILLYL